MCGVFTLPPTQSKAGRWFRLLTGSHQVTRPRKKEKQPSGYKTRKKKKFGELLWTLDVAACFSPQLVDDKQSFFIIPLSGFACELQRTPVLMKTSGLIHESVYFDHASFQFCESLQTSVASLREVPIKTSGWIYEPVSLHHAPNTSFVNHLKQQLRHCQKCKWNAAVQDRWEPEQQLKRGLYHKWPLSVQRRERQLWRGAGKKTTTVAETAAYERGEQQQQQQQQ